MNTARPRRTATVAEMATVPMLAHVAGERLRELAAAHPMRHFTPGSVLLHEGTPATRLLIMLNGQASAVIDHPDGTRSRYPLITGPCVIDKAAILAGGNYPATWVATTPGQALALSGHAFRALLREQHKMREHVLRYLAIQVSQTRAALTARIASSAVTRVARWLMTASGSGARPIVRLPAGQQGIAEELGLSRITVNRALQQLARAGAVRPGPGPSSSSTRLSSLSSRRQAGHAKPPRPAAEPRSDPVNPLTPCNRHRGILMTASEQMLMAAHTTHGPGGLA